MHRSYESISKHNKVRGRCQWGGSLVIPSRGWQRAWPLHICALTRAYVHTHAHACTCMQMSAHTPQDRNAADSKVEAAPTSGCSVVRSVMQVGGRSQMELRASSPYPLTREGSLVPLRPQQGPELEEQSGEHGGDCGGTEHVGLPEHPYTGQVEAKRLEEQIKREFEKLHEFLRDEEKALLSQLQEEKQHKHSLIESKMKQLAENSQAVRSEARQLQADLEEDDYTFLKVKS